MPLRSIDVTVPDGFRDKGKMFRITEMPSLRAERWGMRAYGALVRSGVEVPEDLEGAGMAAIIIIGLKSLAQIPFEELDPLMQEMFGCVQTLPDPGNRNIVRPLVDGIGEGDDITDLRTRLWLRQKIMELHMDFSLAGGGSI